MKRTANGEQFVQGNAMSLCRNMDAVLDRGRGNPVRGTPHPHTLTKQIFEVVIACSRACLFNKLNVHLFNVTQQYCIHQIENGWFFGITSRGVP